MKVIRTAADFPRKPAKAALAIGMFDGVHLGHQQVLRQAITDARQHHGASVAVTFDRHPNAVVAPQRTPPLIYSLPQKLRVLESVGLDFTVLLEFDAALSRKSPEQFIQDLIEHFGRIYSICVGSKFTFGHKRAGDVESLRTLGQKCGFQVHSLAAVSLNGRVVSSTRIRECIAAGDLDQAGQMLGRPYSISGVVLRGDQLGTRLGFPTANLDTAQLALPPAGVYAAYARLKGQSYKSAVNIGRRPTVAPDSPSPRVEAHLLDFSGDLYGSELELVFVEKLRSEQKFPSLEALQEQIRADVQATRQALG